MERLTIEYCGEYVPKDLCSIDRLGGADDCELCSEYCKATEEGNEDCRGCAINQCFNKLGEYENLEEKGKLLKLPCAVGDTVYVLAKCESIPEQLDGTLWDENGAHGTATGYYCPYEDNCPFDDEDFENCEKCKSKTAIFEDTIGDITVGEDGVWMCTENCNVCSQIGLYIFLTREEAEAALTTADK